MQIGSDYTTLEHDSRDTLHVTVNGREIGDGKSKRGDAGIKMCWDGKRRGSWVSTLYRFHTLISVHGYRNVPLLKAMASQVANHNRQLVLYQKVIEEWSRNRLGEHRSPLQLLISLFAHGSSRARSEERERTPLLTPIRCFKVHIACGGEQTAERNFSIRVQHHDPGLNFPSELST